MLMTDVKGDPIERLMGNSVEEMSAAELATYMKLYLENRYDIDLPLEGIVERKTLQSFQNRYGKSRAGRIVQWVMLHHGGRKDGEYVTAGVFSKAMKWWCDQMYLELQQDQQRQERRATGADNTGFFDLRSLRDMK